MKKNHFKTLALLGISSSLSFAPQLLAQKDSSDTPKTSSKPKNETTEEKPAVDANDGNLHYHLMNEEELILELDSKGLSMYKALSPEGKILAQKVASTRCNFSNECKGLNACTTDNNACAGKGSCKGQGKCALADKNVAVKLVYNKLMAEKREATSKTP